MESDRRQFVEQSRLAGEILQLISQNFTQNVANFEHVFEYDYELSNFAVKFGTKFSTFKERLCKIGCNKLHHKIISLAKIYVNSSDSLSRNCFPNLSIIIL